MKNIVTASVEFYFKGVKFSPSLTIELDPYMQSSGRIPVLYPFIATENNIDHYSYEYEMMQAENIKFNQAEGLVADYVVNGVLDIEAFELAWNEQQILTTIQQIVERHGLTYAVQQHPDFEKTLIEAYKSGERSYAKKNK